MTTILLLTAAQVAAFIFYSAILFLIMLLKPVRNFCTAIGSIIIFFTLFLSIMFFSLINSGESYDCTAPPWINWIWVFTEVFVCAESIFMVFYLGFDSNCRYESHTVRASINSERTLEDLIDPPISRADIYKKYVHYAASSLLIVGMIAVIVAYFTLCTPCTC